MQALQALLLDLDGVLRLWDRANTQQAESLGALPAGAIHATAFAPDLLQPAITGQIDDPTWRSRVAERLATRHPQADAELAVSQWSKPVGRVDHQVLEIVRSVRSRATVVLVTNATSRLPADLHALGLDTEFDHIVNSADLGYSKPDPRFFEAAVQMACISPQQGLFVDDNLANTEAAATFGFRTHAYVDPAGLHAAIRHWLQR